MTLLVTLLTKLVPATDYAGNEDKSAAIVEFAASLSVSLLNIELAEPKRRK